MKKPVLYLVKPTKNSDAQPPVLVSAANVHQALAHVAKSNYSVQRVTPLQVASLMSENSGVKLETAVESAPAVAATGTEVAHHST